MPYLTVDTITTHNGAKERLQIHETDDIWRLPAAIIGRYLLPPILYVHEQHAMEIEGRAVFSTAAAFWGAHVLRLYAASDGRSTEQGITMQRRCKRLVDAVWHYNGPDAFSCSLEGAHRIAEARREKSARRP